MMIVNRNCTNWIDETLVKGGSLLSDYATEQGSMYCTGIVEGKKVKVFTRCVEPFITNVVDIPSHEAIRQVFPKQEKRIIVADDAEDLNSVATVPKGTIAEDWIDNDDGTYELTVDGIHIWRIRAKSIDKLMN